MKTKLYFSVPVLLAIILVFSIAVVGASYDKGIIKNFMNKDLKRVIADSIDEESIKSFREMGCFLKNRLKGSASFECPEGIIPRLNVREARVFRIMDLNADQQIGADKVWAEGITGSGVNVAILDTGIDTDHPELQDSYLGGYDYANNDPNPEDDHGHGTHVAGIISSNGVNDANSKGVSPGAGIYMYKVCNSGGSCYEDDMMAAMEAAVQTDAKVMSISIGGGSYTAENCDSDPLAAKVNWVVSQGLSVVVAAGNDGRGVSSPGCASGAIGVGAVDSSNNVVYFSGRGPALDIVAPGYYIYSTLIDGYGEMSGTSMATPHVAGVAALLLDTDSTLTDGEIKNALYTTASPVNKCYKCAFFWWGRCFGEQEVTCTPEITGAGVVNAYEAYLTVKSEEPEPDSDGDGVPDSQDACPSTYGTYCNGCPEPSCVGCQSPHCPATGQPYCVDDDSNCEAPNAIGTCSAGECSFECYYGYDNCNGDWGDGCEVDIFSDNNNCGYCGNACGEVACPESGCGAGECGEEEYGTYPPAQQTSCENGTCSGECTATCEYDPVCDLDDDDDGVPDAQDACPTTYGTDCNGCPNPCSGCAVMNCPETGAPTCEPGNCPDTTCPGDGCGVGTCASNEYGTHTPASNTCGVVNNVGTCTENPCTLECVYDPVCEQQPIVKCWSAEYTYIKRSSSQFKKFCKCAEGTYGYESYGYVWGKQTAYQYRDSGDNENWETRSSNTYFPAYRVRCTDGNWYNANQDYYYG